eukprot:3218587-Rhodomonas_salina.1
MGVWVPDRGCEIILRGRASGRTVVSGRARRRGSAAAHTVVPSWAFHTVVGWGTSLAVLSSSHDGSARRRGRASGRTVVSGRARIGEES